MADLDIRPLGDEHAFGSRIRGVTAANVADEAIRQQLRAVFEDRGVIVFEDMEPSEDMQLALSDVFGPSQAYAIKNTTTENAKHPGLISLGTKRPNIVEIDGRQIAGYVGWHFDACYVPQLNRAGLLRMEVNAPKDGRTGFADGIQMYRALAPEWRANADTLSVIYYQHNMFHHQRFGLPRSWKLIQLEEVSTAILEASIPVPRSVHPAVWSRANGDKVLHVSPWQADGVAGLEGPEGDALLAELIEQMYAAMQPYWHDWKSTDMVIWDNWRFLHAAGGHEPGYPRNPLRTTIQGDYGLGSLLEEWTKPAHALA
ncbi:MAG: TauD/TfdA family dioxygenase [Sphingomonadales bacterium]|nr:TauD/TfdA family dioxygenase [Sphingomonadales bacterium]